MTDNTIDWQKWKCRCSSISKMMANSKDNAPLTDKQVIELAELEARTTRTEKQGLRIAELVEKRERSKDVVLSSTCIDYLLEEYAWMTERKCSITKDLNIEQIRKGILGEKEGREVLSYVEDYYYEKNDERLYSDFLAGEPDTWKGKSIREAEEVPDIKVIWDMPGFLKKIVKPIEPEYADQLRGYGLLTGAKKLFRANVLIDTPEPIRNQIKMRLFYQRDYATIEAPEFLKEWDILEQSMLFGSIAAHKRLHRLYVEPFTPPEEKAIYERVQHCRQWLSEFHEKFEKLNK